MRLPSLWPLRPGRSPPMSRMQKATYFTSYGTVVVCASEAKNKAHLFLSQVPTMIANVVVDAGQYAAQYTPDGSELWVRSEVDGTGSARHAATADHKQKNGFAF